MAKVVIGFSKSKMKFPIIAWLIMLCEKTNFSHAYVKVWSESLQRDLIYQATGSGVYFVGNTVFSEHHAVVEEYELDIPAESRKNMLQWAVDESGKKYGKKQFLGIGIKRLAKLFGKNIKNPFSDGTNSYICTELVAYATQEIGLGMEGDLDSMGLKELRNHVKSIEAAQHPKQLD